MGVSYLYDMIGILTIPVPCLFNQAASVGFIMVVSFLFVKIMNLEKKSIIRLLLS